MPEEKEPIMGSQEIQQFSVKLPSERWLKRAAAIAAIIGGMWGTYWTSQRDSDSKVDALRVERESAQHEAEKLRDTRDIERQATVKALWESIHDLRNEISDIRRSQPTKVIINKQ